MPDVTGHLATTEGATSPLARGYAVFGSDGGHKMTGPPLALDGNFALNREALDNWLGDALKKTRDVSFAIRSEEHTSELQSLMRISYAVFCLKKKYNYHT